MDYNFADYDIAYKKRKLKKLKNDYKKLRRLSKEVLRAAASVVIVDADYLPIYWALNKLRDELEK